jgi:hypothetical protein
LNDVVQQLQQPQQQIGARILQGIIMCVGSAVREEHPSSPFACNPGDTTKLWQLSKASLVLSNLNFTALHQEVRWAACVNQGDLTFIPGAVAVTAFTGCVDQHHLHHTAQAAVAITAS